MNEVCTNGDNKGSLSDKVNKMEEWKLRRRTVKRNNEIKCKNKQNNVNDHETLSDDDEDDTEEEEEEEQRLAECDEKSFCQCEESLVQEIRECDSTTELLNSKNEVFDERVRCLEK